MNFFARFGVSALVVSAASLAIACGSPADEAGKAGDEALTGAATASLRGSYDGVMSTGPGTEEAFKLRVESDGHTVTISGETVVAVFKSGTLVEGTITANGTSVTIEAGGATLAVTSTAEGVLSGTMTAKNVTHPVTLTPVDRPEIVLVEAHGAKCTSIGTVLFGGDRAREAKYNAFFAATLADECHGQKILRAEATAWNASFASISVEELAFLNAFGGDLLEAKTVTADGTVFDPADSFVGTQASLDAIVSAFAEENAFAFSGGEGGVGDAGGASGARAWAQDHIRLENGKIVAKVAVDDSSFRFTESAVLLDLPFAKVAAQLAPGSVIANYVASTKTP